MKRIMLYLTALLSVCAITLAPAVVSAQDAKQAVCNGVGIASGAQGCAESGITVAGTIPKVISILSIIVGLAAVVMIIIGGLKYVTSAGESSKISSAKDTVLYAAVGLAIALLAQVIVRFVFSKTTS